MPTISEAASWNETEQYQSSVSESESNITRKPAKGNPWLKAAQKPAKLPEPKQNELIQRQQGGLKHGFG